MAGRASVFNYEGAAILLLLALQDGKARNYSDIAYSLIDVHEGLAGIWSEHGGLRTTVVRYAYNNDWIAPKGRAYAITPQGFEYLHESSNNLSVVRFRGRNEEFAEKKHRRRASPKYRRVLTRSLLLSCEEEASD